MSRIVKLFTQNAKTYLPIDFQINQYANDNGLKVISISGLNVAEVSSYSALVTFEKICTSKSYLRNPDERPDYIRTTSGKGGYFAIYVKWNETYGMYEPHDSGYAFATLSQAIEYAKSWAESENVEYREG